MKWKQKGSNHRITPEQLHEVDRMKFKKRGDILSFASTHPGALTAGFLAEVHRRCGLGAVKETKDLRVAPVRTWAAKSECTGLSDLRDCRELATLATVMDHINLNEVAQALDVIVQRIGAIQIAKQKGSTWERAERSELIPGAGTLMAPSGVLQLTQ